MNYRDRSVRSDLLHKGKATILNLAKEVISMSREEYLERGGFVFCQRVMPALLSVLGFAPNTYLLSFRQGKVFSNDLRYHTVVEISFRSGNNAHVTCDLYADGRYLDFTQGQLTVLFKSGVINWFSCQETLYRGIILRRKM